MGARGYYAWLGQPNAPGRCRMMTDSEVDDRQYQQSSGPVIFTHYVLMRIHILSDVFDEFVLQWAHDSQVLR